MYIHDKNDLKSYVIKYIICLLPLYIYGFYKNGILLYINDYSDILGMFKIFYLVILSVLAYFITNKILKKEFRFDLIFLSLFLLPLFCPYNINLLVYFAVVFICLLLRKFYNVSLLIVFLSLLASFSVDIDNTSKYFFTTWDLLWGRNIGGIGSTSIVLGLTIFIVLSLINNHKYFVSISGLFSLIILSIVFKEYTFLTNGNIILTLLFIASITDKSPVLKKNMVFYGLVIGALGFILCKFVSPYYGMALSTCIVSMVYEYIILR